MVVSPVQSLGCFCWRPWFFSYVVDLVLVGVIFLLTVSIE